MRGTGARLRCHGIVSAIRHFIGLEMFEPAVLRHMITRAAELKRAPKSYQGALAGKTLAMIFETPSTRTRISFDVAMNKLGGRSIALSPGELQLGRGESIGDTARVLSRYVDAVLLRTTSHDSLLQLVHYSGVPLINGLTDRTHPCQLMADIMTFEELRGPIKNKKIAWLGDGNNIVYSLIEAAIQLVGDKQGYDFIIDAVSGALVFADPDHNLTFAVIEELRKSAIENNDPQN